MDRIGDGRFPLRNTSQHHPQPLAVRRPFLNDEGIDTAPDALEPV
jgi:hypothetical protein